MVNLNDFSDQRLRKIHIGLSDVSPVLVPPSLTNFAQCAYFDGIVGNGATQSFSCPGEGVTGRYLIVQVEHSDVLTICEAEVQESKY